MSDINMRSNLRRFVPSSTISISVPILCKSKKHRRRRKIHKLSSIIQMPTDYIKKDAKFPKNNKHQFDAGTGQGTNSDDLETAKITTNKRIHDNIRIKNRQYYQHDTRLTRIQNTGKFKSSYPTLHISNYRKKENPIYLAVARKFKPLKNKAISLSDSTSASFDALTNQQYEATPKSVDDRQTTKKYVQQNNNHASTACIQKKDIQYLLNILKDATVVHPNTEQLNTEISLKESISRKMASSINDSNILSIEKPLISQLISSTATVAATNLLLQYIMNNSTHLR